MHKHYGLTVIWLMLAVMLLLLVYSYALSNASRLADGFSAGSLHGDVMSVTGEGGINIVQGSVVQPGEPKYRRSRQIKERELQALERDQWLQPNAPEKATEDVNDEIEANEAGFLTADTVLDNAVTFEPEQAEEMTDFRLEQQEEFVPNQSADVQNTVATDVPTEEQPLETLNSSNSMDDQGDIVTKLQALPYEKIWFIFNQESIAEEGLAVIRQAAELLRQAPSIKA